MLPLSVCVSWGFPVPSSLSGVCTRVCMLSFGVVTFAEAVDARARGDDDEDGKFGLFFHRKLMERGGLVGKMRMRVMRMGS